jgi:hypothetical protein
MEGGAGSGFALGYLASFVLLSAVSVAGYVFRLPLAVLSVAIVVSVVGGAAWVVRDAVRRRAWPRVSVVALMAGAVVLVDLAMGLRVGGHFGGDARYHVARVRILLDHGFNNWDPLVAGHHFDATYHTNLYHALMASMAQLTGLSPSEVWAYTWSWAKLASASAAFHLAWTVFRERVLAWTAAAAFAVWMAPSSILLYPNTITKFWLVPLALAFVVEAVAREGTRRPVWGLAAVAWVLPQVHGLYYVFVGIMVLPVLAVAALHAWWKRVEPRRFLALALALGVGAPWLGVTVWHRAYPVREAAPAAPIEAPALAAALAAEASRSQEAASAAPAEPGHFRGFVRLGDGQVMLDPGQLANLSGRHFHLWVAMALLLATVRRRPAAVLAGTIAVTLVVLYTPPLCTALVELAKAPWVVRRLSGIATSMHVAIVPGALLWFVWTRWRSRWTEAFCVAGAVAYGQAFGVDREPWSRESYLDEARDPMELPELLARHARKRELLYRAIPSEAVVLAPLGVAGDLLMNCDCYRLALDQDEPARRVRDMAERRAAVTLLLGDELDLAARVALLRRYGVRHMYVSGRLAGGLVDTYAPILRGVERSERTRVLTLHID